MSLLEVRGLTKRWASDAKPAVADVTFTVDAHQVLAVVGESGAGKSTLARMIAGLTIPTAGSIVVDGHTMPTRRTVHDRHRVQLVGQNPRAALNRRRTVRHALEQVVRLHDPTCGPHERRAAIEALVAEVGVDSTHLDRRPHTLSGGQLARVLLARALLCSPSVLVMDEPTASLDGPTKQRVVGLLRQLTASRPLAVIVITHEVPVARRLADRTVVMLDGAVVERGDTRSVLDRPTHEYTRTLVGSELTVQRAFPSNPGVSALLP